MQKLLFPLALLLVTFTACGQASNLDQFYKKFNTEDGNGSINPAFLLNMSGQASDSNGLFFHLRGRFSATDKEKIQSALQEHRDS